MKTLNYSEEAAARIKRYQDCKAELKKQEVTQHMLEDARSYAVEALHQIMRDNTEAMAAGQ